MNTVNKQALLEWIDSERMKWNQAPNFGKEVMFEIQSGSFDSPSDDRLRAALEKIANVRMSQHMTVSHAVTFMHSVAVEALSSEPNVIITSSGFVPLSGEVSRMAKEAIEEAIKEDTNE